LRLELGLGQAGARRAVDPGLAGQEQRRLALAEIALDQEPARQRDRHNGGDGDHHLLAGREPAPAHSIH